MDSLNALTCASEVDGATRSDSPQGHKDELSNIQEQSPRPCHHPSATSLDTSVTSTSKSDSASPLLDSRSLNFSTSSVQSVSPLDSTTPLDSGHIKDASDASSAECLPPVVDIPELPDCQQPEQQSLKAPKSPSISPTKDVTISDLSTSQHSRTPSLSSLFISSPKRKFDSDVESPDPDSFGCETSDSTSVEIISACLDESFVSGRFEFSKTRRLTPAITPQALPPPSTKDTKQEDATSQSAVARSSPGVEESLKVDRPCIRRLDSVSTSASTSQSPTPHPLISRENCLSPATDSKQDASPPQLAHSPPNNVAPKVCSLPRIDDDEPDQEEAQSFPRPEMNVAQADIQESDGLPDDHKLEDFSTDIRTPNVYINGIPPHCPDESLFNLTKEYGTVLSVRTFTRCVGEKMSGYGFVLFATLEAAERCIEDLRKYRNLHPSFSKMVHKIPGTPYASGTITLPPSGSLVSLGSQPLTQGALATIPTVSSTQSALAADNSPRPASRGVNGSSSIHESGGLNNRNAADLSFREKLDILSDSRTTNLYMEGLPLSIDERSLAALVSPGQIVSCRFFKTKLSNPPRMIAFVRLDTRKAAEEVIEKLNGRVVRGWYDNGSRIAVRFADTPEQRELRRAERLARGEEEDIGESNRITMAQAALLNLRGAELQMQNASRRQYGIPTRQPVESQGSSHAHNSMQGLGFMGPQGAIPNYGRNGHPNGFKQSANGTLGQAGRNARKATTQLPFQNPEYSFPQMGMASRNQGGHHRRGSFSSTESFVTNPDSLAADFSDPRNAFSSANITAETLAAAEQLAVLQQQTQLQQLRLLQEHTELVNGSSHLRTTRAQPVLHNQGLMPSVDIMASLGGRSNATNRAVGASTTQEANVSPEIGFNDFVQQHVSNNANLHRQISQAHSDKRSGFGTRNHAMQINSVHELAEGLDTIDSQGSAVISPALTFSSRTPSTLSPATPFLPATFGTPASAPAVPTAKLPGSNGFKARQQYQQHHHRPSYQIPNSHIHHHRANKVEVRH